MVEHLRRSKRFLLTFRYYGGPTLWILFGLWISVNLFVAHRKAKMQQTYARSLSRERRFIYMDNQRRLSLPPGSVFALSGILSLPFLNNLPVGYGSGLTIAIPVTVNFDKLGLTSEDNLFGNFDFLNLTGILGIPRMNLSLLRPPSIFENLPPPAIEVDFFRRKRFAWNALPGVNYAGGDREIVYQIIEDVASSFGLDGPECVKRAICEVHEAPLTNHGFFGEALLLLLSPSSAAFAEFRLGPYLEAERNGRLRGNCSEYLDKCHYSIFFPNERKDLLRREKRFFAFGPHRRIIFPPSTAFVGTPTLNLPFMRNLPTGFSSTMSYSVPFTFDFDGLGFASPLNNFGYIPVFEDDEKRKREAPSNVTYPGGDRELIYAVIVDALDKIGFHGNGCLLKTVCEIHEMPLLSHGLFGEYFQLLLTPSRAPNSRSRLAEFADAEELGRNCGDCSVFDKVCPKSLFSNPGAGLRHRKAEERLRCARKYVFDFDGKTFLQNVKSKYMTVSSVEAGQPHSAAFALDVSKQMNFQSEMRRIRQLS